MGVGEASDGADLGCGEAGAKVRDCFFAVALCLGGHAAPTHKDQVGDIVSDGAQTSQIDDFVSGGTVAGFEVERLGVVAAASKCDKGDFHPCGFEGTLCEKSPQQGLNFLSENCHRCAPPHDRLYGVVEVFKCHVTVVLYSLSHAVLLVSTWRRKVYQISRSA